jgi:hypothetical protein
MSAFKKTIIFTNNFVKTGIELETDLDKWLYVLKNMSQMDKIPVYLRKPIFEKLFSIAEYTNPPIGGRKKPCTIAA